MKQAYEITCEKGYNSQGWSYSLFLPQASGGMSGEPSGTTRGDPRPPVSRTNASGTPTATAADGIAGQECVKQLGKRVKLENAPDILAVEPERFQGRSRGAQDSGRLARAFTR